MRNIERIRHLKAEELAKYLIKSRNIQDYDEGIDGEMWYCGNHDEYIGPDGYTYDDYDEALKYAIEWLNEEYDPDKT